MAECRELDKLPDLRSQHRELCWKLYGFRDAACVIADDFLSRLRLGNRILALNFLFERDDVVALVSERLCALIFFAHREDDRLEARHLQPSNFFGQTFLANERRRQDRQSNVKLLTVFERQDGDDAQLIYAKLECIQLQLFQFFEVVDKIEEGVVADDVHAFGIAARQIPKHEAKAASDGLFGEDVRFRAIGAQANDNCYVLHVPALAEH